MATKSYVDPCLFIPFIHIDLNDSLVDILRSIPYEKGKSLMPVISELDMRKKQILFHENYHYWQGLRLPFVYRYAFLSFIQFTKAFSALALSDKDFKNWDCILLGPEFYKNKYNISHFENGDIAYGNSSEVPDGAIKNLKITILDLLECAASLAEFQYINRTVDINAFKKWAKRNPMYLDPFLFVTSYLESEAITLRILIPLINTSFFTTDPIRTFTELLARMWGFIFGGKNKKFIAQKEPCRWPELFQFWLDDIQFEAEADSNFLMFGGPYHRLTIDNWMYVQLEKDKDTMTHPFLSSNARKWHEEEKECPFHTLILDQPAWADIRYQGDGSGFFKYTPPLSVYHFHGNNNFDQVYLFGTEISNSISFSVNRNVTFQDIILDVLTMQSSVRKASGVHFNTDQRTCKHSTCSHYEHNYCSIYPLIPNEYESCGFPRRIEQLINESRDYYNDQT